MDLTTEQVADLRDDGDTVTIGPRHAVRLVIRPDMDTSINDYDCYGKIEWIDRGHHRGNRPDGFNGAAMKLWGSSDPFWWQPPAGITTEQAREESSFIRELAEYGFSLVGLELLEVVEDSLGGDHTVEVDAAWLGGVDSVDGEYLAAIVRDLATELKSVEVDA